MTKEIDTSRKTVQEFVSRNLDITNDGLYAHLKADTKFLKDKVRGSKNAYLSSLLRGKDNHLPWVKI